MEGYPEAYCERWRRARRSHVCCECHGTIPVGEKYRYVSGVWDHEGRSFKQCSDCAALYEEISQGQKGLYPEDRVCLGQLNEAVFEGDEEAQVRKFLDIKRKRGAVIQPWMEDKLNRQPATPSCC